MSNPVRSHADHGGAHAHPIDAPITAACPPVVVHIPHASTDIPPDIRTQFLLNDGALCAELCVMTDHLTDVLFHLPAEVATTVRYPVSRLVVDPERFAADKDEPMAARGMGVLYTRTAAQRPLRRPLTSDDREACLERWYRPHHRVLSTVVDTALAAHGRCLLIDAHSFPSSPLPYEFHQDPKRPDICIGTDAYHTPRAVLDLVVGLCEGVGWRVAVNRPFAGALVPMRHYRQDSRVTAVMIEVNRRLYLDEATGAAGARFTDCLARLQNVLRQLLATSGGWSHDEWSGLAETASDALSPALGSDT